MTEYEISFEDPDDNLKLPPRRPPGGAAWLTVVLANPGRWIKYPIPMGLQGAKAYVGRFQGRGVELTIRLLEPTDKPGPSTPAQIYGRAEVGPDTDA